jgi:hypothetical protein
MLKINLFCSAAKKLKLSLHPPNSLYYKMKWNNRPAQEQQGLEAGLINGKKPTQQSSRRKLCKAVCGVFVLVIISIGIYVGVVLGVLGTASPPTFQVVHRHLSARINPVSILGNISVAITNNNKVAFQVDGTTFPAYYPIAVESQSQVGTFITQSGYDGAGQRVETHLLSNITQISLGTAARMTADILRAGGVSLLITGPVQAHTALLGIPISFKLSMRCETTVNLLEATSLTCSMTL